MDIKGKVHCFFEQSGTFKNEFIKFSDKYGLTKAVLEERKTQTRRFVPKELFTLQWDVRGDFVMPKYKID